jgi:hypothetical protein
MMARRIIAATTTALAVSVGVAPTAIADDAALNGTFTAFSDGQWAKTNSSYHDEASVTQRWTITSTCSTSQDCTGTVTSDQGWTADIVYMSGRWKVSRTVENWEPCQDGTALPGKQAFIFWHDFPIDPNVYTGWDKTEGPTGACGFNKVLDVELPFTLTRAG